MDKELVKKLLYSNSINIEDLNTFIVDYIKEEKGEDVTLEELKGIVKLIQMNMFNLEYALVRSASKLNLSLLKIHDKNGQLIRKIVYEN